MANAYTARRGAQPPAPQAPNLFARRTAAVALGLFLNAFSFNPVSWIVQPDWQTELDGPYIVDRVISPVLLLGAAILHWYIAGALEPVLLTVTVPSPGGNVQVQNGEMQMPHQTFALGLWEPSYFWPAMVLESAVLWSLSPFSNLVVNDLVHRSALVGVLASVWIVGWNLLPFYRKEQAWRLMKEYVFQLIAAEMFNMAFGRRQRRRR